MIILPKAWWDRWRGDDVFDRILELEGRVYREQKGRTTFQFAWEGKHYFAKVHRGVGWKEIFKNLFQLRLPVLGAWNEWRAVRRLERLGIQTVPLVGYGRRGWNPARMQSFVITEALADTVSLENFCREWRTSPPTPRVKRALIQEVARTVRTLHKNGMNHRDLYLSHFLLRRNTEMHGEGEDSPRLYLIDLHRAQVRGSTPLRWRLKDLAGLCFSSMDIGLTRADAMRFVRAYEGRPLKTSLRQNERFWIRVRRDAIRLYRKVFGREPVDPV